MKLLLLILVPGLLLTGTLAGQERMSIAVLELEAGGISAYEAQVLTNRLRTELFNTDKFTILERDKMDEILIEQGFQMTGCTSIECAVQVGKLIGVKQMVAGDIGKLDNLYTINVRLIDVESGRVINTATVDCECPLKTILTDYVRILAQRLAGLKAAGPATPGSAITGTDDSGTIIPPIRFNDFDIRRAHDLYQNGTPDDIPEILRTINPFISRNNRNYSQILEAVQLKTLVADTLYDITRDKKTKQHVVLINFLFNDYKNTKNSILDALRICVTNSDNTILGNQAKRLKLDFIEGMYKWKWDLCTLADTEDLIDNSNNPEISTRAMLFRIKFLIAGKNYEEAEREFTILYEKFPNHYRTQEADEELAGTFYRLVERSLGQDDTGNAQKYFKYLKIYHSSNPYFSRADSTFKQWYSKNKK